MKLQDRIDLFARLGAYLEKGDEYWDAAKDKAFKANAWFTPEFIDIAVQNICNRFLKKELLEGWAAHYHLDDNIEPKNVGIVMAGNIPLVGFHDLLAVFITGHKQTIKLSSKDEVLPTAVINKLKDLDPRVADYISIAPILKGCDAYIATGSNNSARYFEQYFSRYPSIIRKNKTSIALLTGNETAENLEKLSDDVHLFFGLGCRNVTKIFVPRDYDFLPLLNSFNRYSSFRDHHKYSNNYDYQLSILLLNNQYYMTNGSTLLVEHESPFSAIGMLHFEHYDKEQEAMKKLAATNDVQCTVGQGHIPFGRAQEPGLFDYADGVDTVEFLLGL